MYAWAILPLIEHNCLMWLCDRYNTETWASEGEDKEGPCPPLDFESISKKGLFYQFRGAKNKFHHFWPPWNKFWENPLLAPPGKKPSDAHVQKDIPC